MNSLGLKPTLDEVKQMIVEIDVDGDGRINFEGMTKSTRSPLHSP